MKGLVGCLSFARELGEGSMNRLAGGTEGADRAREGRGHGKQIDGGGRVVT